MCHLATLSKMSCCARASQTRLDSLAAQPPNRCRVSATPPSASSCAPCVTYIPLTSYPILHAVSAGTCSDTCCSTAIGSLHTPSDCPIGSLHAPSDCPAASTSQLAALFGALIARKGRGSLASANTSS